MERNSLIEQGYQTPQRTEVDQMTWALPGAAAALEATLERARHLTYGAGSRLRLPESELEFYPEHGVVRFTNLTQGVEVTLAGQHARPTATPDGGLVFEQPGSDRWLSV